MSNSVLLGPDGYPLPDLQTYKQKPGFSFEDAVKSVVKRDGEGLKELAKK